MSPPSINVNAGSSGGFSRRLLGGGMNRSSSYTRKHFNNEDLIEKSGKLLSCIEKYRHLCTPKNYEAKLQSQILEFDIKNL